MLRSLRGRLILSHLLLPLLIIPIMGIALVYMLETRVVLPSVGQDLINQAALVAELAAPYPQIWSDPAQANTFAAEFSRSTAGRVSFLATDGRLLGSEDPAERDLLGQIPPDLTPGDLGRQPTVHTEYSQRLGNQVAEALYPVAATAEGSTVGFVRLTYSLENVYERFRWLRNWIAVISILALVFSAGIGWVLAMDLARPLGQVTRAVQQMADSRQLMAVATVGPQELRTLTQSFNALVERLHALEEDRQHLLANLVHELGRPLGAMRSALQALQRGADADQAFRTELLDGIDGQMGQLQRLIEDLALLYANLTGTLKLDLRPLSLNEWLPGTLSPWRALAQQRGLNWQAESAEALPIVQADDDRLGQVLGKLLSNAIKFTPRGGTVTVSAGCEDAQVWLRVADTGTGIAPQEQTEIFTPFFRGQVNRRFPQGMGLGLSIARELIAAHAGRLEVTSAPGAGSRFTIWLPALPASD